MNSTHQQSATIAGAFAPETSQRIGWLGRLFELRDRLLSHPAFHRWAAAFPLTRPIALRRSRAVFDLCAGFAYTQVLTACVQLRLFDYLAGAPRTLEEIARYTDLPRDGAIRLVRAAMALRLLSRRPGDRYGNGPLGSPLIGNVAVLRMIEHNVLMYEAISDPVAVLRGDRSHNQQLAEYYPYMSAGPSRGVQPGDVQPYCELMASTVLPVVHEVIEAVPLGSSRHIVDVGGGEGVFAREIVDRYPDVHVTVFDLPAVVERARTRLDAAGITRVSVAGGDFHRDELPKNADTVTFLRVLLDHDDAAVLELLARARRSLVPGGQVVIAEPFAGASGARTVGDAYFGFYLAAAGRGRARTVAELEALLIDAGFRTPRVRRTRYPVYAGVLTALA